MQRERKTGRSALISVAVFMTLLWICAMRCFPVYAADNALSANPDIRISRTDAILVKGQKVDLFLYDRNNAEDSILPISGVSWKSSKPKVASVTGSGTVKAKKAGKAVLKGTYGGKTFSCKITVYSSLSSDKRLKLAKKEAKRIVRTYIKSNMSQPIKALVLASYVLQNVSNQLDQSNQSYRKNYGNEAYAALIMHLAACSGHCRAFMLLCKEAGLKCKHINAGKWTHQWNAVKLNGKWVQVDTQAGYFNYNFSYSDLVQYTRLTFDYNHIGPVYRKIISGMRQ